MSVLSASGHYLLVAKTDIGEKVGSLFLPANQSTPVVEAVVMSVGGLVEADAEVGDQVILYHNTLSLPLKADGKEYFVVKDEHVLAVRHNVS